MAIENQPDRFGCATVALVIVGAFTLLVTLVGLNPFMNINWGSGVQGPAANAHQGQPGANGAGNGVGNAQAAVDAAGDGQPPVIAEISDRYFTSGSVTTAMSGGPFLVSGNLQIDPEKAYAKDGLGWIAFADGPTDVLISINEPENAIAVARGDTYATAQDDACAWDVHVTEALVSGHISCPSVPVVQGTETVGTTSIELDFSAGSEPVPSATGLP